MHIIIIVIVIVIIIIIIIIYFLNINAKLTVQVNQEKKAHTVRYALL